MTTFGSLLNQPADRALEVQQRSGQSLSWNVDLANPSDSVRVRASGDNSANLHDVSFFDSSKGAQSEIQKCLLQEVEMMVRLLKQVMRALKEMLQQQGGGDSSGSGGKSSGGASSPKGGDGSTGDGGGGDTKSGAGGDTKSNAGGDTKSGGAHAGDNGAHGAYADTGVVRGKTIYRNDFNGARGEMPDQKVFDTAHIGPDGKTRQRGPSIDEDGITSQRNTVLDGDGHLQLFPQKEKTYDPVAKEYVDYTKGTMNTAQGLRINLKDHPDGVVIEVRAKHPTAVGSKFDALWIMTDNWAADASKGQKQGDTVEFDAAEGKHADITVHYPTKVGGVTKDHWGGSAHPTDVDFNDGKFHTYTVVIKPNKQTGRGDVVEYVDGKKEFEKESVFPGGTDLHLRSSLEVSPKWTKQVFKGEGGMDSNAAGVIDYLDVSELGKNQK